LDAVYGGDDPDCPQYEVNTATLDAFLTEMMGLTLAETNKVGMGNFIYLPEYNTYYWAHGDTNYRAQVTIAAGERRDGNTLLYYEDGFMGGGWKCLTLQDNGQGGYWFVSNTTCERPEDLLEDAGHAPADPQPMDRPDREPVLTIPLSDLEPYMPRQMEPDEVSADAMGEALCDEILADGTNIVCCRDPEDPVRHPRRPDRGSGGLHGGGAGGAAAVRRGVKRLGIHAGKPKGGPAASRVRRSLFARFRFRPEGRGRGFLRLHRQTGTAQKGNRQNR